MDATTAQIALLSGYCVDPILHIDVWLPGRLDMMGVSAAALPQFKTLLIPKAS